MIYGGAVMPASVEKLPDLPIAVVRYGGHVTVEDTRAVFAQIAGLVDTYGTPFYRITCVNTEETAVTFDEVMMMTTLSSRGLRGSATDPDVYTVLAGAHPLVDLFVEAMRQEPFGAVEIPVFTDLATALDFVMALIQKGNQTAQA